MHSSDLWGMIFSTEFSYRQKGERGPNPQDLPIKVFSPSKEGEFLRKHEESEITREDHSTGIQSYLLRFSRCFWVWIYGSKYLVKGGICMST